MQYKLAYCLLLFTTNLLAICTTDYQNSYNEFTQILNLNLFTNNVISKSYCDILNDTKTTDNLKQKLTTIINNQTNRLNWEGKNRHQVGAMLNQCTPSKNTTALIISFAGTGAYNPRSFNLMAKLIQCKSYQKLTDDQKKSTYAYVINALEKSGSIYTKWSGIEKGPMSMFIKDPDLNKISKNFKYAIFASEEAEVLSDPGNLKNYSPAKILREFRSSTVGSTIGIQNALACSKKFYKRAKELKISPKLIVMSHSSGGRSAVKYLEKVKERSPKFKVSLVLTLDPVKEAHQAAKEVTSQYLSNKADDLNPFTDNKHKKPKVYSRQQKKVLYRTSNAKRWVNFYQNKDSRSGDVGFMTHGIAGSPIYKADQNYFVSDGLDSTKTPHGEITYHQKTLAIIKKEITDLFN
jgi:hypothetical protein